MIPDSYEDEVRKRLGLLKDVPVVSMPGMSTDCLLYTSDAADD